MPRRPSALSLSLSAAGDESPGQARQKIVACSAGGRRACRSRTPVCGAGQAGGRQAGRATGQPGTTGPIRGPPAGAAPPPPPPAAAAAAVVCSSSTRASRCRASEVNGRKRTSSLGTARMQKRLEGLGTGSWQLPAALQWPPDAAGRAPVERARVAARISAALYVLSLRSDCGRRATAWASSRCGCSHCTAAALHTRKAPPPPAWSAGPSAALLPPRPRPSPPPPAGDRAARCSLHLPPRPLARLPQPSSSAPRA